MNKVFLVGRLASDPEAFTTKNGINQSRLTIVTQDNTNKQEAYFFPCIAWRNQANFINTYLKKGDLVSIDGKLTRRSFTTKDGRTSYVTEVVVDAINSLGSKRDANSGLKISNDKKSIDAAFPESTVSQDTTNEKPVKVEVKHDENVEWFDEVEKE